MNNSVSIPTRLTREYGLRHPIANAGMGFVAYEKLAAAVSNAGGLGVLGATPDPPQSMAVMVERLRALTDGPWGVDLICAQTGLGPATVEEHIDLCVQLDVPLVIFHHDIPPVDWVRRLHLSGAKVWMQVSSLELAVQAMELGVEGLVVQGSEAGGHNRSEVGLSTLLWGIRGRFPKTLLLAAGGIVDGKGVASAIQGGADGVWVGTRLVASEEAYAHRVYKDNLVRSTGATVRTTAFGPEWPGERYQLLATAAARDPDASNSDSIGHTRLFPHSVNLEYEMPAFSAIPPNPQTVGKWDAMAFPAGHGVGGVRKIAPVSEIIAEMMVEAAAELLRSAG